MRTAIDKYAGGVFGPDDVRILVAAFDAAWRSLLASGITFQSDRESKAVCDTVPDRMANPLGDLRVPGVGEVSVSFSR